MSQMDKYRFWRLINNRKLWAAGIAIGIAAQGIGMYYYSFKSVFFVSGILFIATLWLLTSLLITLFTKKTQRNSSKALVSCNAIFIIILIAEMVLRLTGLVANYSERRSWHYESLYTKKRSEYWIDKDLRKKEIIISNHEYAYARHRNAEHYSDKEWDTAQMRGKQVILALGDSFTEGDGAHADSTWVAFLERSLNQSDLYFMNAGLCGSDPCFNLYNLRELAPVYHPDLVILCVNASDIGDIMVRGGMERFTGNRVAFRQAPCWEFLYAYSHLSRLIFNRFYTEYFFAKEDEKMEEARALKSLEQCLLQTKDYCTQHNIRLMIVFHPFKQEAGTTNHHFVALIEKLRQESCVVSDIIPQFLNTSKNTDPDDLYWKYDGHHNARGYSVMAECIGADLKKYFPEIVSKPDSATTVSGIPRQD